MEMLEYDKANLSNSILGKVIIFLVKFLFQNSKHIMIKQ